MQHSTIAVGQDICMALLIYRATPISNTIPSPAELLIGRSYLEFIPRHNQEMRAQGQLTQSGVKSEPTVSSITTRMQEIYTDSRITGGNVQAERQQPR